MDSTRADASALRAVRTYAQDLESERHRRQLPTPAAAPVKTSAPAPKVKSEPGPHISTIPAKKMPPLPRPTPEAPRANEGTVVSIPPFHTLHKKPLPTAPSPTAGKHDPDDHITVIAPLPKSNSGTSPNTKNIFIDDSAGAADGTIITDTKRQSFHFFPTLIKSIKDWFAELETAYKQRKTPKYTVPETDRRKGVIQRATSQTGKIATADYEVVRRRIKNRGIFRRKDDDSPTTWTANTETIFPLLPGPKEAAARKIVNVQVVPKKRAATLPPPPPPPPKRRPEIPQPVFVEPEPATETSPSRPPREEVPIVEAVAPQVAPASLTEEETAVPEARVETPENEAAVTTPTSGYLNAQDTETEDSAPAATPEESSESAERNWNLSLRELSTNALTLTIVGVLVICTATVFGVRQLLTGNTEVAGVVATTPESLIAGASLIEKTDTFANRSELLSLIASELRQTNSETVQVVFVARENRQLVPPSTLLSTLSQSINQNFARSVTHLTFGKHEQNQPYLALRVTDSITARGGLLQWEDTIAADLSPLFAEPQTSTSTALFRDRKSGDAEVRSLEDLNGTSYLTYGFAQENTIIITTTPDAFAALAALVTAAN